MNAGWIAENLLASALLMALVLLVRGRTAALFGARVAYALWALPLLRMVLPSLPPAMRPSIEPVAAQIPFHIDLSGLGDIPAVAHATSAAPAVPATLAAGADWPAGLDWTAMALALWLGGAVIHFGWQMGLYHRFLRVALRGSALLCRRCGIKVHVSATVRGPVAAGVFDRRILLPGDFSTRYSRREQRLVLAHEVAHHVRGDLVANFFALAMLSLHWFNPLAHIAYRSFRADQELACDETVLAAEPADERHSYAIALLKSAGGDMPAAACGLGAARIKRRLKMMASGKISPLRRLAGTGFAALVVGGGLLLTASGSVAASDLEHPLAPAAPIAPIAAIAPVAVPPSAVAPDVPVTPDPPMPPAAPTPPAPPVGAERGSRHWSHAQAEAVRKQALEHAAAARAEAARTRQEALREAAQARAAAAEDRARALEQAAESRNRALARAADARAKAAEARRKAETARAQAFSRISSADIGGQVHAAMAQARAELQRECGRGRGIPSGMADGDAISMLAANCVDMRAIRGEVERALREAQEEIHQADLTADQRRYALSALNDEMERMKSDGFIN